MESLPFANLQGSNRTALQTLLDQQGWGSLCAAYVPYVLGRSLLDLYIASFPSPAYKSLLCRGALKASTDLCFSMLRRYTHPHMDSPGSAPPVSAQQNLARARLAWGGDHDFLLNYRLK